MNGIFDENGVVKKFDFHRPLLSEIDSIINKCISNCFYKYYHTHKTTLEYNVNFTNRRNNEQYKLPITYRGVDSCELNQKLKFARRNAFKCDQIKKLTLKIYAIQSDMTIRYYLKHRIPIMHRRLF